MSSSMRKIAKTVARLVRVTEGQTRAQQLRRSVVVSGENAATVSDLLAGAAETAAITEEQAGDIARLDESDILAVDLLADAGDYTDLIGLEDAMSDQAQETSDNFDQAAELDEAIHAAHMSAIASAEKVGTALAAANGAAAAAAASTETALGFARYSQIDGGEIFPPLPEDGPRQGAELVLIDVNAHPYQVNVWNGTAWVKSQTLADQILVLGEDGTVQIENGRIVSPTIIGGEFYGNYFEGGRFTLPTVASETQVLYDNCEVVGPWKQSATGPALTRSSAQKKAGSYSVQIAPNGIQQYYSWRPLPVAAYPRGGYVTAWVFRSVEASVQLQAGGRANNYIVPAGVWTQLTLDLPPGVSVTDMSVIGWGGTGTMFVDEVRVVTFDSLAGGAAVERDSSGRAVVRSTAADGMEASLKDGKLTIGKGLDRTEYYLESGSNTATIISYFGAGGVLTGDTRISSTRWGSISFSANGTYGTAPTLQLNPTSPTGTPQAVLYGPMEIMGGLIAESLKLASDTDWVNVSIPGTVSASSSFRWRVRQKRVYVEFDITYSSAAAPGAYAAANLGIFGTGFRPAGAPSVLPTIAGNQPVQGYVNTAGEFRVRNNTAANQARFYGGGSWAID